MRLNFANKQFQLKSIGKVNKIFKFIKWYLLINKNHVTNYLNVECEKILFRQTAELITL